MSTREREKKNRQVQFFFQAVNSTVEGGPHFWDSLHGVHNPPQQEGDGHLGVVIESRVDLLLQLLQLLLQLLKEWSNKSSVKISDYY